MHKKCSAQNIIEFVFVFLVTMSIFLSVIELGLYWRAKYSVANIANEITANIQIVSQNTKSHDEILQSALLFTKKCSGLLNLSDSQYALSGSDGSYLIKSDKVKHGQSILAVFINIDTSSNSNVKVIVSYRYSGIFLFKDGVTITSAVSNSLCKY